MHLNNISDILKSKKVIFFDMGNTLLHFHEGISDDEKDERGLKYLTDYLKNYNENITFDEVKIEFFDKWVFACSLRKKNLTEYPIEEFLNNLMRKYNSTLTLTECIKAMNIFYTEYRNYVCIEEGVINTLKNLKRKGFKLGIISNSSQYDEVMIECFKKAGIHEFIDNYTFSYYLKVSKPKREIFEAALKKMNSSPHDAVMIGDNLNADIKPAKELGMNAIWLNKNNKKNETDIVADAEIRSLNELAI